MIWLFLRYEGKVKEKNSLRYPSFNYGERSGKKKVTLFHWSTPSKSMSQSTFVVSQGSWGLFSIRLHEFNCTFPLTHSLWLHFLRFLFGNTVIWIPFHFSLAWLLKCTQVLPICWYYWQGLLVSVLQQDSEIRLAVRILYIWAMVFFPYCSYRYEILQSWCTMKVFFSK